MSDGILMPALQHQWRFRIKEDEQNIIPPAVTMIDIDYVNRELLVCLEQPKYKTNIQEFLFENSDRLLHGFVETMEGTSADVASSLRFDMKMKGHSYELRYDGDRVVATHDVVFSISSMIAYEQPADISVI